MSKSNIEKSAEQISEYLRGNPQHVRVETIKLPETSQDTTARQ